ncbi:MAG: hypothetical protein LBL36_06070 [Clostridiales Family XIII bacterium]|nr:hypothetical protein [Clostridiales Family XIII bacterium]
MRDFVEKFVPMNILELAKLLSQLAFGKGNAVSKWLDTGSPHSSTSEFENDLWRITGRPLFHVEPYDKRVYAPNIYEPAFDKEKEYMYGGSHRKVLYNDLCGGYGSGGKSRGRGWKNWSKRFYNTRYYQKNYVKKTYIKKHYANYSYNKVAQKIRLPYVSFPGMYRYHGTYWPYTSAYGFRPNGKPQQLQHQHTREFYVQKKTLSGLYDSYSKYRKWTHGYAQPNRRHGSQYYPHWQTSLLWAQRHGKLYGQTPRAWM